MAMTGTARVSIIMPFLNTERFIGEAIESVLAQTYDQWELVLVDDGSTDGSTAVACRYAAMHPTRVRYFEHEGHRICGASVSRNLGISHAAGEYIAFLDADDVYLPHKLEQQVAILDARPDVDMLYGATIYWHSWTGRPEDAGRDYLQPTGIAPNTVVRPPELLPPYLRQEITTPCTCSVLVRRAAIERVGGFEASFRYIYTDQVLYTKLCLHSPVLVTDGCWDKYRQHPDSSCAIVQKNGRPRAEREAYLIWVREYLSQRAITDPDVWQALDEELWPYRHPIAYRLLHGSRALGTRTLSGLVQLARDRLPAPVYQRLQMLWRGMLR